MGNIFFDYRSLRPRPHEIFLVKISHYRLATYEESARSEGAGEWKIFFSIIFPLCKPALAVTIIHSVMTSWNMYIYPLILTSSESIRTLPLGIAFYRVSQPEIHSGHLMAGSVIVVFPVIVVFLLFQKQIITSLTQGGIKG